MRCRRPAHAPASLAPTGRRQPRRSTPASRPLSRAGRRPCRHSSGPRMAESRRRAGGSLANPGRGPGQDVAAHPPRPAGREPAPPGQPARGISRWASPRRRERVAQIFFVAPAVVYMLLFFGYPIVKNVVMGFEHYTTATFYTGEAPWVGLKNYSEVIHSDVFSKAAVN